VGLTNGNCPTAEPAQRQGQEGQAGAGLPLQPAAGQPTPLRELYSTGQPGKEQTPQKLTLEAFQARWLNSSLRSLGTEPWYLLFTPCTQDIKRCSNPETVVLPTLPPQHSFNEH